MEDLLLGGMVVACIVLFAISIRESQRYWSIVDTPTIPAGHAFPGFVEVKGHARLGPGRSVVSPLSGADCAWVQWRIKRGDSDGEGKTVAVITSPFKVFLDDESGTITVFLDDQPPINVRLETFDREELPTISGAMLKSAANGHLLHELVRPTESEKSLAFRAIMANSIPEYNRSTDLSVAPGSWTITERRLEVGDPLLVQGRAGTSPEGGPLVITAGPQGLLAYHGDETSLTARMKWLSFGLFTAFLGTVGMCTSYWSALIERPSPAGPIHLTLAKGIVGGWFALLLVLLVQAVRVRNRVVQTREQVFSSWALIDVAHAKRTTLLPALHEVVRRVSTLESDNLSDATWLRTWADRMSTCEPGDITIDSGAQVGVHLGGLIEHYPALKTNENFQQFFRSMVRVEAEIATARTYYLDACEALRNRLQSFPDSWLALFAGPMPDMVDPCHDVPELQPERTLDAATR